MPGRFELRRAWDAVHQTEPLFERPEEGIVAFLEHIESLHMERTPVLDVGCGRGRNLPSLDQSNFCVHACDLSPAALRIAKSRGWEAGNGVRFVACDLTNLPYVENSFAATICVHVLPYHFRAGIIEGVRELLRVLRPNGWLYFDLLDLEDAEYGRGKAVEEHTFLDPGGLPLHFSSRQEIDELLQGFALERAYRLVLNPSPDRTRVAWCVWGSKRSERQA